MVSAEVGFLFYEQTFFDRFFVFGSLFGVLVGFDAIIRRNHIFAGVDRAQFVAVVRKNETKLQLRHAGKLFARFPDFFGAEAGNLNQNAIVRDRTDHRLADSKHVHPFSDHFDCLVEHSLVHFLVTAHQTDQERSAALNIEAKLNFFFRRPNRRDAECDQQHHKRTREHALSQPDFGCEIPTEQDEQADAGKKC